jgi:signal transduction histidine kinase
MAETAHEVVQIMSPVAKKAGVNLSVEIEKVSPSVFDRNKIIQMLTNLLSNAIKFTPAAGKVSLQIQNQNDEIVITVSDTGLGIPKSDLYKVFQRFYRVKRPGKEISGTGLGLPIVAQIVALHSGRIMVDSEPDKGTTFTVYLPNKPPQD